MDNVEEEIRVDQAEQGEFIVSYWRTTEHPGEFTTKTDGVDGRGDTLQEALHDLSVSISLYIDD